MNLICKENLEAIILKRYMNEEKKKTAKPPWIILKHFLPIFDNRVCQKGEKESCMF